MDSKECEEYFEKINTKLDLVVRRLDVLNANLDMLSTQSDTSEIIEHMVRKLQCIGHHHHHHISQVVIDP